MSFSVKASLMAAIGLLPAALAAGSGCGAYAGGIPPARSNQTNSAVIEVAAGEVLDGGWARYDRGAGACSAQSEGDWEDAVFYLHEGATLQNVIIGANQAEGVHCDGHCSLNFVWFEDVCEDAISIKNDKAGAQTWIVGGGAYHGDDKIVQHNGCGTVNIVNFYVEDYGKLYRSCGNCDSQCRRTVNVDGVMAVQGGALAGINQAYGDTATLRNVCYDTTDPCTLYDGCAGDCEPVQLGSCTG